jgi:hypothetical protein
VLKGEILALAKKGQRYCAIFSEDQCRKFKNADRGKAHIQISFLWRYVLFGTAKLPTVKLSTFEMYIDIKI